MGNEKEFRLKLTGKGISLDRTISADMAQQIVAIALGATGTMGIEPGGKAAGGAGIRMQPPVAGRTPPSIREFLLQQEAKRIPEQIATMALYLKNHRNTAVFKRKDLVQTFEGAQEPVPKNLSRDIKWTVRNGWIAPKVGIKDTYYLTSSGEAAVGAKFPADVRRKTTAGKVGRRGRKSRKPKGTSS